MENHSVFLCIGGNLGEREANLEETLMFLRFNFGDIVNLSSVYETEAWGMENAPAFLNQVVELSSELTTKELLQEIKELEEYYGRTRKSDKYESREMDIDILFYDDEVIQTEKLEVPHPRMALRNFVLVPLCEIAPDKKHPVLGKTITELLKASTDTTAVKKV